MNKKVCITIRGLHAGMSAEEEDEIEIVSIGTYAYRGGKHMVRYEEPSDESSQPASTLIKFTEHEVEVIAKGTVGNHMVFTEGQKHVAYYETPFGSMNLATEAYEVTVQEMPECITIEVNYGLEVNYDYVMNRRVYIKIEEIEE